MSGQTARARKDQAAHEEPRQSCTGHRVHTLVEAEEGEPLSLSLSLAPLLHTHLHFPSHLPCWCWSCCMLLILQTSLHPSPLSPNLTHSRAHGDATDERTGLHCICILHLCFLHRSHASARPARALMIWDLQTSNNQRPTTNSQRKRYAHAQRSVSIFLPKKTAFSPPPLCSRAHICYRSIGLDLPPPSLLLLLPTTHSHALLPPLPSPSLSHSLTHTRSLSHHPVLPCSP